MTKICVLQHVEPETPGIISEILAARGVELHTVRADRGEVVPGDMDGFAALLVMGGPMGVYESDRYPFLRAEIRLIEKALADGKPVLGICLGSQLLAAALGARVYPAQREIGWLPLTLPPAAAADPLWAGVESPFTAMLWHGDVFDLPRGATSLAASAATPHQAFRHGTNVYGMLFHMEVTEEIVRGMVRAFPGELKAAGVDAEAMLAQAPANIPAMHRAARTVFDRWAGLLEHA